MQIGPNVVLCHGIMRHGCGLPVCAVAWGLSGGLASHAPQTLSQHRRNQLYWQQGLGGWGICTGTGVVVGLPHGPRRMH